MIAVAEPAAAPEVEEKDAVLLHHPPNPIRVPEVKLADIEKFLRCALEMCLCG